MRIVPSAGVHEPQRPFWLVTQRTLAGMAARGVIGQVPGDQPARPGLQLVVGAAEPLLAGGEAGQHPLDPLGLLGAGELVRDEHDDPLAVPVCGHRPTPALAAPHFDDRLARPAITGPRGPEFGFTMSTLIAYGPWYRKGQHAGRARKVTLEPARPEKFLTRDVRPTVHRTLTPSVDHLGQTSYSRAHSERFARRVPAI